MKKIKEIEQLEILRDKILFPSYNFEFENFHTLIMEVIRGNLPVSVGEKFPLEYSSDDQKFYYTAWLTICLPKDITGEYTIGRFSTVFPIDPKRSIGYQIQEIQKHVAAIEKWAGDVRYDFYKEKQKKA